MIIQQLSIFVENQAGRVASIVQALSEKNVDITALTLADTTDFGIMRLIVDQPEVAMETLRAEGIIYKMTDVLVVHLDDQPGGLATVLSVLSKAEMAIDYMYAFMGRQAGEAMMVFRVAQPQVAANLLISKGFSSAKVSK